MSPGQENCWEAEEDFRLAAAVARQVEIGLLAVLGAAASGSDHPASRAIYSFVANKNIKILNIDQAYEKPGYGVKGLVEGEMVFVGSIKFLESNNIKPTDEEVARFNQEKSLGRTLVVLGSKQGPAGFVSLADAIRPQISSVIDKLKKMGIRIVMLTGDNETAASQIAAESHISEFKANLLPEDKVNVLKKILNKKYKTAMVGDGVNDAAALSLADIGVAMGTIGSDAAIEAADIALMKDNLKNIIDVVKPSRSTIRIVHQNLFLWGVLNALGLGLVFIWGFLVRPKPLPTILSLILFRFLIH